MENLQGVRILQNTSFQQNINLEMWPWASLGGILSTSSPQYVFCMCDLKASYCKCGNFRVGVIFEFFAMLPSSQKFTRVFRNVAFIAKISPTQKLNPYDFMKEIGV